MTYDAITIGSGISGLSCAAFLSMQNRKVLVLEANSEPGGCMQPFSREHWSWNLGLQWICRYGALDADGMMLRLLTEDQIVLNKLDDSFMHMRFANHDNFQFVLKTGRHAMQHALTEQFPQYSHAINKYYSMVNDINAKALALPAAKLFSISRACRVYPRIMKLVFPFLSRDFAPLTKMSLAEVVENHLQIEDPLLRDILYSYWHFFGMPPSGIPFLFYAVAVGLQESGVYYPKGGAGSIIELLKQKIEKHGGHVRSGTSVKKIIIENGKATGVLADGLGLVYATHIISSAGIRETIENMIAPGDWNDEIKTTHTLITRDYESKPTILILRIGLQGDLTSFGIKKATYRIIAGNAWDFATSPLAPAWEPTDITINFPSFYDTGDLTGEYHTAEVVQLTDYKWFEGETPTSDSFQSAMEGISKKLCKSFEAEFPGIQKHIRLTTLTTPFDVKSLTRHYRSAIYGVDINKASEMRFQPHSGIDNLFFTGEDIFAQGITLTNGMLTASAVTETNLLKSLRAHL